MKNTRETAFQIIYKVLEEGEYSHLVLGRVLKEEQDAEKRDRAFVTRLTEGTLEHLITLDYILNQLSKTPVKKMKPVIRTILRMSVYQLLYMDSVPDSAVCNEAVKLVKAKGLQGLSGFVNGVLRSAARQKASFLEESFYPDKNQRAYYLSVRYSMPQWLCEYFIRTYGMDMAEQIVKGSMRNPNTTIRCNKSRISPADLSERLQNHGLSLTPGIYAKDSWMLSGYDSLERIPEFTEGLFQIQDESSMLVVQMAGLKKDNLVLDVCSAPGGKALHAANLLAELGGGRVIARDVSEKKTSLIQQNKERLKADNIEIQVWDATVLDEKMIGKADVVIADLPCSGIGIMAKKPEIRYRMSEQNQKELVQLQKKILDVVQRYVKPGGILMFSTCTINKEENEDNVRELCERYGFSPALSETLVPEKLRSEVREGAYIQFLPGVHECDGFFIARLIKDKEE